MESMNTQDTAVAMIDTGIDTIGKIILCSIYWDGRIDTFPEKAVETIEKANAEGHTLILGGDVNARSKLYGSNETDKRGKYLEKLFLSKNITFLNSGDKPTCTASVKGSVIDITGITNTMEDIVHNWRVSNKESFSDHNIIEFNIKATQPEAKFKTTMSEEQKLSFMKELDENLTDIFNEASGHHTVTVDMLEDYTTKIIKTYKSVEQKHSTKITIKPPKRSLIWKDERVKEQNKIKNQAKYEYRAKNTAANKNTLNREHKTLTRVMSKVRKEIFRGDMTKITTEKDMSRLTKYAKNGKMKEVGLIKDASGNLATSPEAAIDALCKAHFPDAKNMSTECVSDFIRTSNQRIGAKTAKTYNWITTEIIRKAINSFKNNKAPGLDGITPNILKLSGSKAIDSLKLLFEMQITLQYTPSLLRTSKVAFIGKADKDDYTLPKSFRPISLTPFIFIHLERVASWYIIHKTLKENPLNKRQHAYRTGKSTESAISQVINQIEKGLLNRSYTLACFIDISSAFDRLDPD